MREEKNQGEFQIANRFRNGELIRCLKTLEDGSKIVRWMSPTVVRNEIMMQKMNLIVDDPNADKKLGNDIEETETENISEMVTVSEQPKEEITAQINEPEINPLLHPNLQPLEITSPHNFLTENESETKEPGEIKQTSEASSLIERFEIDDNGRPKKKRKRITKIKIHHAD